jgi:hypothetical protein
MGTSAIILKKEIVRTAKCSSDQIFSRYNDKLTKRLGFREIYRYFFLIS